MADTYHEMEVYDFGELKRWPKEELKAPYEVLNHYEKLMESLKSLPSLVHISSGRPDHLVKSLDTTAYALQQALYNVMVLREALTGSKTKAEAEAKYQAEEAKIRDAKTA